MASRINETFQCRFCPHIMRFKGHLKEHYNQKHYFCMDCNEKLENRHEMLEHLALQHGQKLRCDFCQYSSLRPREIQAHLNKFHSDEDSVKKVSPAKKRKISEPLALHHGLHLFPSRPVSQNDSFVF